MNTRREGLTDGIFHQFPPMTHHAILYFPENIGDLLRNPRQFMDEVVEQMEQRFQNIAIQSTIAGSIEEGQTIFDIDTIQLHINSD